MTIRDPARDLTHANPRFGGWQRPKGANRRRPGPRSPVPACRTAQPVSRCPPAAARPGPPLHRLPAARVRDLAQVRETGQGHGPGRPATLVEGDRELDRQRSRAPDQHLEGDREPGAGPWCERRGKSIARSRRPGRQFTAGPPGLRDRPQPAQREYHPDPAERDRRRRQVRDRYAQLQIMPHLRGALRPGLAQREAAGRERRSGRRGGGARWGGRRLAVVPGADGIADG
jgi:hypothetical protein